MSSKKRRQTLDKLRREQMVRNRRADKLQKKEDARTARAASDEAPIAVTEVPEPAVAARATRR
jgi:hypothetical protein